MDKTCFLIFPNQLFENIAQYHDMKKIQTIILLQKKETRDQIK